VFYLDELQFRPDLDLSLKVAREEQSGEGDRGAVSQRQPDLVTRFRPPPNLLDWISLMTLPRAGTRPSGFVDVNAASNQQRFYRMMVAP